MEDAKGILEWTFLSMMDVESPVVLWMLQLFCLVVFSVSADSVEFLAPLLQVTGLTSSKGSVHVGASFGQMSVPDNLPWLIQTCTPANTACSEHDTNLQASNLPGCSV